MAGRWGEIRRNRGPTFALLRPLLFSWFLTVMLVVVGKRSFVFQPLQKTGDLEKQHVPITTGHGRRPSLGPLPEREGEPKIDMKGNISEWRAAGLMAVCMYGVLA